jgi:hypothetical protein
MMNRSVLLLETMNGMYFEVQDFLQWRPKKNMGIFFRFCFLDGSDMSTRDDVVGREGSRLITCVVGCSQTSIVA